MSAQVFCVPTSEIAMTFGAFDVLPLESRSYGAKDEGGVVSFVPRVLDVPDPLEVDWMDCIVSPSSATPTAVLAVLVGQAACYLLFNVSDPLTRKALALARSNRRMEVRFNNGLLPIPGDMFQKGWGAMKAKKPVHPRTWAESATKVAPGLPRTCAIKIPGLANATSHTAVLAVPASVLLAVNATIAGHA